MTNPNTVRPKKTVWGDFLKARKAIIAELWDEGYSFDSIVKKISVDPRQLQLLLMTIDNDERKKLNSASLNQNATGHSND